MAGRTREEGLGGFGVIRRERFDGGRCGEKTHR